MTSIFYFFCFDADRTLVLPAYISNVFSASSISTYGERYTHQRQPLLRLHIRRRRLVGACAVAQI
jgi:hypothetical protein